VFRHFLTPENGQPMLQLKQDIIC